MNVEMGTETPIFLFWEYLFRNFGILSLQCWVKVKEHKMPYLEALFASSLYFPLLVMSGYPG